MATPKAVLILSGKGGVGKTLVAVNLSLYLKDQKVKVGLLDADFSASNTGYFLNVESESAALSREEIHPVNVHGIELFSFPVFLGERSVSMNGDQYGQLLRDAVKAASWEADYLIVDCPAGFGDELKMAAKIFADSLLGSVIVMQPAHELDARRALRLHKDLGLPVLGLIENMSYLKVGRAKWKIFGKSVVDGLAEEFKVPVFGKIPLSMDIRRQVEQKQPKLEGDYAKPIINAVEAILKAQPQKPGFLTRLKKFLTGQLTKLLVELTLAINREINIPEIQNKWGYPGGTIIRMNILNEDMASIIAQTDWIVSNGKLTVADGSYQPDAQIDITPKAVKWALTGDKIMANGYAYTFADALRLGHMRIYGDRSMARGAFFLKHVFTELSKNETAMGRLRPLLEVL